MNIATLQAFDYFPSKVYRDDHPEWVDYIKSVTQKYYDATPDPALHQSVHMGEDPDLKFLVDYLLLSSIEILRSQGYDVDKYNFYLSGLWQQDVGCYASTNVHVHKNSQIAGWVFLDTSKNGSYPIYYDSRKNKEMIELDFVQTNEITDASTSVHFNNVTAGTILFANSWLQHQLAPNMASEKVKTVHFTISHRS